MFRALTAKFRHSRLERPRLELSDLPSVIYAIGDVHGCLDLLRQIEQVILRDSARIVGSKYIVMLGDYVDRGPLSAGVLDHLLRPAPVGFTRLCVAGNHESMMLSYLNEPRLNHRWLDYGGLDTLRSYGVMPDKNLKKLSRAIESSVPESHKTFLADLPSLISMPGYCFSHAGIRSGVPITSQLDRDLLWGNRSKSVGVPTDGVTAIHGHTPVSQVEIVPFRVNVDTGAYATGKLSGVKIVGSDIEPISNFGSLI